MQERSKNPSRKAFIKEVNARHRRLTRVIYLLLLFAMVVFGIWDGFVLGWDHPLLNDFLIDRALLTFPFILAGLVISFSPSKKIRQDWWMTLCLLAIGLSTVQIYRLFAQVQIEISLEGLMLFMLTVFIIPSMFAIQKVMVGLLVFVAHLICLWFAGEESEEFIEALIFLGLINIGGAVHSFSFDKQLRDNFKNNKILEKIAHTDHLTGAHNRHRFEEDFNQILELAQSEQAFIGLYIVDIDQFKEYNDHYGHLDGDDCLVAIAQTLLSFCTHEKDRCIRFGGEEFILVKYAESIAELESWGQSLLQGVRQLNLKHEYSTVAKHVTVSIGAAFIQANKKETRASLMARADAALYQAKKSGRNQLLIAGSNEAS